MKHAVSLLVLAAAILAPRGAGADAPAEGSATEVAPSAPPRKFVDFDATGGALYESLDGIPSFFGGGSFALGHDFRGGVWRFRAAYARGRTEDGLDLDRASVGFSLAGVIDAVRIGVATDLIYFAITRKSDGLLLDSYGFGLAATLGVDIARIGESAFYVELRPYLDIFDGILFEGAGLSLGYRF